MTLQVLILAAEGISMSHGRKIPACLQPMRGGTSLIDQQIRELNLCGIKKEDIYIVIGKEGAWNNDSSEILFEKYNNKNIIINPKNNSTTSEISFYLFMKKIEIKGDLLIINSDAIFDVKHIDNLIDFNQNSLLTRSAKSINERGIKIESEGNKIISLIEEESIHYFPWDIYAGLLLLTKKSIDLIRKLPKVKDTKGLLYALDKLISIKNFKKTCYDFMSNGYENDNSISRDLKGGSYANLSRRHIVRKEARGKGVEKLIWEIDWLNLLPNDLKPYFPKVIDFFKETNYAWFEMPYYSQNNLRKSILTGYFDVERTLNLTKEILDFCFNNLYTVYYVNKNENNWIVENHFLRVAERLHQTMSLSTSLNKIIKSEYLILNGKKVKNIPQILKKIIYKPELIKILNPKKLSMIHGDLHFQNILVGPTDSFKNFMLADPRGELLGSDLYYDLGKLWHSFNGLYDLIHTDLFQLKQNSKKLEFDLIFPNKDLVKTYELIKKGMKEMIIDYQKIKDDTFWDLKIYFNECMHFCSVMPFHIQNDEEELKAKALYLRGVYLLNKFYEEFNINQYEEDKTFEDTFAVDSLLIKIMN